MPRSTWGGIGSAYTDRYRFSDINTKILTAGIHRVRRDTLQCAPTSESDLSACYAQAGAEIAENSHLWMNTR